MSEPSDTACWAFAEVLRAGDGLGELGGARAVLERLDAKVTTVWGVQKPENPGIHWLRTDGVNMTPLTEDEARTEAARRPLWTLVSRQLVRVDLDTPWATVPESAT